MVSRCMASISSRPSEVCRHSHQRDPARLPLVDPASSTGVPAGASGVADTRLLPLPDPAATDRPWRRSRWPPAAWRRGLPVRSSAWICDCSSTHNTGAARGGPRYNPLDRWTNVCSIMPRRHRIKCHGMSRCRTQPARDRRVFWTTDDEIAAEGRSPTNPTPPLGGVMASGHQPAAKASTSTAQEVAPCDLAPR